MKIAYLAPSPIQQDTISLEQAIQRRVRRRRRVAKRMAKRCPLFAVEFMRDEFPEYDYETFVADVTRKTRPGRKKKGKSQLQRQGRYPLYQKALNQYALTKDPEYLYEAQRLRNRLFLRFEVWFSLNGERRVWTFPSTTSLRVIEALSKIRFQSWEELEEKTRETLRYAHIS